MDDKNNNFNIQMISQEYGAETFSYLSEAERIEGLMRLMLKAETLNDNISREYYFAEDDNGESPDYGLNEGDTDLVASWTGKQWKVAEYGVPHYRATYLSKSPGAGQCNTFIDAATRYAAEKAVAQRPDFDMLIWCEKVALSPLSQKAVLRLNEEESNTLSMQVK